MNAVYQSDLTEFIDDLAVASSTTAEQVAAQVTHSMGARVADLARRYAPRDTGELAASIAHYTGPTYSSVKAEAPHAAYVEFGTWSFNVLAPKPGTYTILPKRPGGVLRFRGKQGNIVFTKKVEHPGIPPQPFMARAHQEVIEDFTQGISNVGVVLVMGGRA